MKPLIQQVRWVLIKTNFTKVEFLMLEEKKKKPYAGVGNVRRNSQKHL